MNITFMNMDFHAKIQWAKHKGLVQHSKSAEIWSLRPNTVPFLKLSGVSGLSTLWYYYYYKARNHHLCFSHDFDLDKLYEKMIENVTENMCIRFIQEMER